MAAHVRLARIGCVSEEESLLARWARALTAPPGPPADGDAAAAGRCEVTIALLANRLAGRCRALRAEAAGAEDRRRAAAATAATAATAAPVLAATAWRALARRHGHDRCALGAAEWRPAAGEPVQALLAARAAGWRLDEAGTGGRLRLRLKRNPGQRVHRSFRSGGRCVCTRARL